jgi:thymidylate synthase
MQRALDHGAEQMDRTGTDTRSVFGHQMRFDLSQGFPVLTTKKLLLRSIIVELLWFLRGDTNVQWLNDAKSASGTNGPTRTATLARSMASNGATGRPRTGGHIDQIAELIETLKVNPAGRRMVVSAWNPGELHAMALSPCHCLFQCYVANGKLNLQLYQRSADIFVGVPFFCKVTLLGLWRKLAYVANLLCSNLTQGLGNKRAARIESFLFCSASGAIL